MKRSPEALQALLSQYQKHLSETSAPFWMDVPDILDILDHYEQTRQNAEFEVCLHFALRMHPNDQEVLMRKAYHLKNQGRWCDAESIARAQPDQEHVDILFFVAEEALGELRYDDAQRIYEMIIEREKRAAEQEDFADPETKEAFDDLYLEIAELFLDYGSEPLALLYLERIANDSSLQPRVQLLKGEIMVRYGKYEGAVQQVEKVLEEDPYHLGAWIFRAELANDKQDFAKCQEAAEYALAIEPENVKALRLRLIALIGQEDWDKLLEAYDDYKFAEPNDYTTSLTVGEMMLSMNEIGRGRRMLRHAAQTCNNDNPDKQRIIHDIAISYAMEGNIEEAYLSMRSMAVLGVQSEDILFQAARIALTYAFHAFGYELLRHCTAQLPPEHEANLQVAHLMWECRTITDAPDIIEPYFAASYPDTSEMHVYLAFAAYELRKKEAFGKHAALALRHQPTLMQEVFKRDFPNALAHEYAPIILKDYFSSPS